MISAAKARRVQVVGLDVDGTLTDGGIYLGASGGARAKPTRPLEFKKYDIRDGLGVHLLRAAGIKVVVVTGRESESVRMRAAELRVDALAQDPGARKLPLWRAMLTRFGVAETEAAFVGDDLPDLAILRSVGLAVAVADAAPEVVDAAHVHLSRPGGGGAVREFAELLLRARGDWSRLVEAYVQERSVPARRRSAR
jgi:3-deoxy-D-manno-octulosonate 8-phosphate phosphatase (KDO 8-P phosphatase)